MINRLLDRARANRDRRRWNHTVRRAHPGDHATVTHIGPGWITWSSGPIRRNPIECPWTDPSPGELTVWRRWSAGRLMAGDTRLIEHTRKTWLQPVTRWLDLHADQVPGQAPPMLTQPATALAVAVPGTKVTVWWHLDDDPLTRRAVQGQVIAPEDDDELDTIAVGGLDEDAEVIHLDAIDAARLGWVTEVAR